MKRNQIIVQDIIISIKHQDKNDFICLTDIARYKDKDRSCQVSPRCTISKAIS